MAERFVGALDLLVALQSHSRQKAFVGNAQTIDKVVVRSVGDERHPIASCIHFKCNWIERSCFLRGRPGLSYSN